jgi:hypothetical protein
MGFDGKKIGFTPIPKFNQRKLPSARKSWISGQTTIAKYLWISPIIFFSQYTRNQGSSVMLPAYVYL